MPAIYLLSGPEDELLHQCAARISATLESPLIIRATSLEQSFLALDEIGETQDIGQVILMLPWSTSLSRWCRQWRHREGHQTEGKYRLRCAALCLRSDNLDAHLEKSHVIDEMSWAERFIESIEAASTIIVDKPSKRAEMLCMALNPSAELRSVEARWDPPKELKRPQSAWNALINEQPLPALPGVQRFFFSARRPFDKERLSAWLREPLNGIVRVGGFFWVADSPHIVARLSVAGSHRSWEPAGTWWIGMRRSHWPKEPERLARIQAQWHPDFGDRLQALGCIGVGCDSSKIRAGLESCLLRDEELDNHWVNAATVPNPFPPSEV